MIDAGVSLVLLVNRSPSLGGRGVNSIVNSQPLYIYFKDATNCILFMFAALLDIGRFDQLPILSTILSKSR